MLRDYRRLTAVAALAAAMFCCSLAGAQQPQYAQPQFDQRSERHPQAAEPLPDVPPQSVEVPAGPAVIQPVRPPYPSRPQYLFLSPNYRGQGTIVPAGVFLRLVRRVQPASRRLPLGLFQQLVGLVVNALWCRRPRLPAQICCGIHCAHSCRRGRLHYNGWHTLATIAPRRARS